MSAQSGDLFDDRGAVFSDYSRYRYQLWRRWEPSAAAVLFVMLDPSTHARPPTIRSCVGFARRWGA
jgi:hypothetical protein